MSLSKITGYVAIPTVFIGLVASTIRPAEETSKVTGTTLNEYFETVPDYSPVRIVYKAPIEKLLGTELSQLNNLPWNHGSPGVSISYRN